MANERIDIISAYQQAFGRIAAQAIKNSPPFVIKMPLYESIPTIIDSNINSEFVRNRSFLGEPLFMPCKLNDTQLPNEPIVEVSRSKRIIKTPIDGMEGEFKELYSLGDYMVTIRGVATNEDNSDEYPEVLVRQLRDLDDQQKAVKAVCKILTIFNIEYLSIESVKFPAIEGAPGMQPYEFSCSSDKFYHLELLEGTL